MISVNVHIKTIMMVHCRGDCQMNMFSYVWKTRFVDQDISEALKHFIVMLFHHTFYLFKKMQHLQYGYCTCCDLDNIPINCAALIIYSNDLQTINIKVGVYVKQFC